MANRSVMTHQFSQVPSAEIQRSSFDRSHGLKTTFNSGLLVPIFIDEALPGDTFNLSMTGFARLATPIKPIMDNLFMETFFFAVPHRLVWDNWAKFCGEQTNPGDSTDYQVPYLSSISAIPANSLFDYMGIPTVGNSHQFSALPARAYNLIWNQWFRDENLQNSVPVPTDDTNQGITNFNLLRRCKRHDYFTSCLPWPQKGPAVTIALGTTAPVYSKQAYGGTGIPTFNQGGTNLGNLTLLDATTRDVHTQNAGAAGINGQPMNWNDPQLITVLSAAVGPTINALREAFQIQRMFERDARGGTRLTEIIRSHFGVISPDARLQRPEYLGGGSSMININPVTQTQRTDDPSTATPQGNLAGIGTASLRNHGFTKSFTEHCIIIGLVNVRADITYQQGLNRMWSRRTRFDFYWPTLSHLGEQEVLNKEIYAQGTAVDNDVFGYQERYAEYRYKPSFITGKFRSSDPQSLDIWHLSQDFQSLPALNNQFIQDIPPVIRVIAVPSEPEFLFDAFFNLRCARPMPIYGTPGMIDHF